MAHKTHVLPRSSTMIERLNRLWEVFQSDDRVLIIINADPDAIASAKALRRLLWRRVAAVTLARTNVIKRPDNLALVDFLKLPLVHISEVDLKEFTRFCTVDSQPHHFYDLENVRFDVVIDHHPVGKTEAVFLDIRPDYGATSTILTEYLRAAKISPSRKLATALFYGIKTDTNNFTRQGQDEDMRAFRFLFPKISQSMVTKIENSEITRSALKYFHKALESVKINKGMALVYLGRVDNPDTLVMLADFFMRVHDIHRTAVSGLFKDKLIVIFRAVGARINAGRTATQAFAALGSAGGHRAMARAEIPLANLDPKLLEKDGALQRFLNRRITGQDRGRKDKPEQPSHKSADKSIDNYPPGD